MATQHAKSSMTLQELFVDALKDLHSSESQLIKALPKMVKAAESPQLKQAFQTHLEETEHQLERVKQAFEIAGEKAKSELCKGMQGIVAEGDEQIQKKTGDLGLIGAGERVEHYEMASYQSAISLAKQLGFSEAESLLSESLKEEENAAKLLAQLSKKLMQEVSVGASA
jgi:ferritin-like metal-binding protein YciE